MTKSHAPLAAAVALSIAAIATSGQAAHDRPTAKATCYGVSLAGKTDCAAVAGASSPLARFSRSA